MEWFAAPDARLARWLVERGIAVTYLVAFAVAYRQFPALLGERGLLPVPAFLRQSSFRASPSLFHLHYSDRAATAVTVAGLVLALALAVGLPQQGPLWLPMVVWAVLWLLYLSIVNVGQIFYAFGWESLLLEAGFLAVFLGHARTAPPLLILWWFRWLAIRVELGAGLIKLRGDPCWRELTCMDYHHETQPMPNPLSWLAHTRARWFHRLEGIGNFVAQLGAPVLLLLPQPLAGVGALIIIATQAYLVVTGNYAWLNLVTIVIAAAALPDAFFPWAAPAPPAGGFDPAPAWYVAVVLLVSGMYLVLSWWPARNLLARRQLMNYAFNRFHLAGTYGAFGSVTRERFEIVLEGTRDEAPTATSEWREYGFKGKPGDPGRRPPQVAPYHLRLDWLMWFAALSPRYAEGWLPRLVERLLQGDRLVLGLLRSPPFPDGPPTWIRARYYRYRFATREEGVATRAWWVRTLEGDFMAPVSLPRSRPPAPS
jgi:hypothetical protein